MQVHSEQSQGTTYCILKQDASRFLGEIIKGRLNIHFGEDTVCVHCDEYPICTLAPKNEPIIQPVLASDGCVYDQSYLNDYLKKGNSLSPNDWSALNDISSIGKYLPIRVSCKYNFPSIIDPRRVISPGNGVIFVARNKGSVDDVTLFIEKRVLCESKKEMHEYSQITAYQFKRLTEGKDSLARIKSTLCSGGHHAIATQKDILDNFFTDTTQIEGRSYSCSENEISALEARIGKDRVKVDSGRIKYIYYSDKLLVCAHNFFQVNYHSYSWATDVFYAIGIIDNKEIRFEDGFKIYVKKSFLLPSAFDQAHDEQIGIKNRKYQRSDRIGLKNIVGLSLGVPMFIVFSPLLVPILYDDYRRHKRSTLVEGDVLVKIIAENSPSIEEIEIGQGYFYEETYKSIAKALSKNNCIKKVVFSSYREITPSRAYDLLKNNKSVITVSGLTKPEAESYIQAQCNEQVEKRLRLHLQTNQKAAYSAPLIFFDNMIRRIHAALYRKIAIGDLSVLLFFKFNLNIEARYSEETYQAELKDALAQIGREFLSNEELPIYLNHLNLFLEYLSENQFSFPLNPNTRLLVDYEDGDSPLPLHKAIISNQEEMTSKLLQSGADPLYPLDIAKGIYRYAAQSVSPQLLPTLWPLLSITQLDLSNAGIGNTKFKVLAETYVRYATHVTPTIHTINLANNKLRNKSVTPLLDLLLQCEALTALDISQNEFGGCNYTVNRGTSGIQLILQWIAKNAKDVRYLNLSANAGDELDANTIIELLGATPLPLTIEFDDNLQINNKKQLDLIKGMSQIAPIRAQLLSTTLCGEPSFVFADILRLEQQVVTLKTEESIKNLYNKIIQQLHRIMQGIVEYLAPSETALQEIKQKLASRDQSTHLTQLELWRVKTLKLKAMLGSDKTKLPDTFKSVNEAIDYVKTLHGIFAVFMQTGDHAERPLAFTSLANIFYQLSIILHFELEHYSWHSQRRSFNSDSFGYVFRELAAKSYKKSMVGGCGVVDPRYLNEKQKHEIVIKMLSGLTTATLLGLAPFGAVFKEVGEHLHIAHGTIESFEWMEENLKVLHEAAYAGEWIVELGCSAAEVYELRTSHHASHGSFTASLTSKAAGYFTSTKFLSTLDWHQNLYGTISTHEEMQIYSECFIQAFTARYADQLALLTTQQMELLEKAMWSHLEVALTLGLFKDAHTNKSITKEQYADYALDWLAYIPMEEAPVLRNVVGHDGTTRHISVDAFLRSPGLRCICDGSKKEITYAWEDTMIIPTEAYLQHKWDKKIKFKHHCDAAFLGSRLASQQEAEALGAKLSDQVDEKLALSFGETSIVTLPCKPVKVQGEISKDKNGKIKLNGHKVVYRTEVQRVEKRVDQLFQGQLKLKADNNELREKINKLEMKKVEAEMEAFIAKVENPAKYDVEKLKRDELRIRKEALALKINQSNSELYAKFIEAYHRLHGTTHAITVSLYAVVGTLFSMNKAVPVNTVVEPRLLSRARSASLSV